MKIYFANHKYMVIDSFNESYRLGNHFLTFNVKNPTLSLDSIILFFTNQDNLTNITIVDDNNQIMQEFNNIYITLYDYSYNVSSDYTSSLIIQLTSTADSINTQLNSSTH